MAAINPFNPDEVSDDREIVPADTYNAHIIESSMGETRSGQMLKLTWEIIDGPLAKRRVWENLNIVNQNAQAQEIAQRSLKRICAAVGYVGVLTDSEHLHFKPCTITVAIRPPEGQYGEQNIVKGYKAMGGVGAPTQAAAPAGAATSTPWKPAA